MPGWNDGKGCREREREERGKKGDVRRGGGGCLSAPRNRWRKQFVRGEKN